MAGRGAVWPSARERGCYGIKAQNVQTAPASQAANAKTIFSVSARRPAAYATNSTGTQIGDNRANRCPKYAQSIGVAARNSGTVPPTDTAMNAVARKSVDVPN
jgi:hypothetical protein